MEVSGLRVFKDAFYGIFAGANLCAAYLSRLQSYRLIEVKRHAKLP